MTKINASAQEVAASSDTIASKIGEVRELAEVLMRTTRKFTL